MNCRDSLASCVSSASHALVAAALAGLLGMSAACDDTESSMGTMEGQNSSGGSITSSIVDPDMTLEKFKAICTEKGGKMEMHPHCGGDNSCKGFSYDVDTKVYTEHTCKGLNTCTGYSCVLP